MWDQRQGKLIQSNKLCPVCKILPAEYKRIDKPELYISMASTGLIIDACVNCGSGFTIDGLPMFYQRNFWNEIGIA